jgi:hypothetical protein
MRINIDYQLKINDSCFGGMFTSLNGMHYRWKYIHDFIGYCKVITLDMVLRFQGETMTLMC